MSTRTTEDLRAGDMTPGVTLSEPADSRNARPLFMWIPCEGCQSAVPAIQRLDGRRRPLTPHCITCHSPDHNACRQCGRCLPEWAPRREWSDAGRIDRRYCSSACRQKAYRQRLAHGVERVMRS